MNDDLLKKALALVETTRKNAYAPYSKVRVGAVLKLKGSDELYPGANVEYVINGVSVCAERSALSSAVSLTGKPEIEWVMVASNTEPALYPCGVCLQAMSEFAGPELLIHRTNGKEVLDTKKLGELLPSQISELPKVLD